MARGTFTVTTSGTQTQTTTITDARVPTYTIAVDWANNGDFQGTYDDVTADTLGEPGLSVERGRDQQRASGDVMVPAASWTLNNEAGTYNPQRGPLSSEMLPGRPVSITAGFGDPTLMQDVDVVMEDAGTFMDGVANVGLLTGTLDDISITPTLGNRTVQLRALGSLLKLRGLVVSTALYSGISTGTAMTYLLQAAGLSSGEYVIDPYAVSSGRTLSWWWVDNRDAYDAAVELLETEGPPAALYEDGFGRVVFESRLYRTFTTRSSTSQGTFRDVALQGGLYYQSIAYEPGLRDIVNDVALTLDVRTAAASRTDVWTYGATLTLDGNGAGSVLARPNDPFTDALVPVVTTDFTLSTGTVSVALSRTSGGSTLISFTGGSANATVSSLKLRAKTVPVTSSVVLRNQVTSAVTDSQTAFGVRSSSPSAVRTLSLTEGQSLVDAITAYYGELRPAVTIEFANADNAHAVQQLVREVSDRIHVINASLGIDDDYSVEQITHEVRTAGLHTVRLGLEKAPLATNVGRWLSDGSASGTSDWGPSANEGIWG